MFDRPYSRTLKAEADNVELLFAAKACVDIGASSAFWQLTEVTDNSHGHPNLPEWVSTYPFHGN